MKEIDHGKNQLHSKQLYPKTCHKWLMTLIYNSSMTGEQLAAPSSPRDGEDLSITRERPKDCWYGTHMGATIAGFFLWPVYFFDVHIIKCNSY
ncbi:hypothetical protein C5167_003641 [Papaver somniferum]|uniref:Uncharacterized protein n=1 Tax=Papaver somniferum TaxID=3469 RepID=A0A4Y7L487_PAPSO|nr:hypothetical protein C5167_003641 [Papaver somniferum]